MDFLKKYWIVAIVVVVGAWTYVNYQTAYNDTLLSCRSQGASDRVCDCYANEWQKSFSMIEYVPFVSALTGAQSVERHQAVQNRVRRICIGS